MPEHTEEEWASFWGWARGTPGGVITDIGLTPDDPSVDGGIIDDILDAIDPWGIAEGIYNTSKTVKASVKSGVTSSAVDKAASSFGSVLGIAAVGSLIYLALKLK